MCTCRSQTIQRVGIMTASDKALLLVLLGLCAWSDVDCARVRNCRYRMKCVTMYVSGEKIKCIR